ncbi:hypothetical protein [Sphingobium xenophagum]|uniref:hypothetical protein n=1 Tax=Sphingobium xenophagum TaxID=121428 RepID=UPI001FD06D60|nr:hypothetical protein [Sphingobium xenophagum]
MRSWRLPARCSHQRHRLSELLWTRSGPYWNGALARTLILQQARQGFLLLLAQAVTPRAVLFGHASPLSWNSASRVIWTSQSSSRAARLYGRSDRQAVARRGYAQAIKSARCFMPVGSAFERDALEALIALRDKLDRHGVDCMIMRDLGEDGLARQWKVGLRREETIIASADRASRDAGIAEDGEMGLRWPRTGVCPDASEFEDGRFVAWLEREIGKKWRGERRMTRKGLSGSHEQESR